MIVGFFWRMRMIYFSKVYEMASDKSLVDYGDASVDREQTKRSGQGEEVDNQAEARASGEMFLEQHR